MAEFSGLVELLIRKGVVTEQEYFEASLQALTEEVARYEARLSELFSGKITLG